MNAIRLFVTAVLVGATVALVQTVPALPAGEVPALEVPYTLGSWQGVEAEALDAATEDAVAADLVVNRTYVNAGSEAASLYIAYYMQQRPGTSIHSPLHCLPGSGWDILSAQTISAALEDGTSSPVRRVIAQKERSRIIVLYWYFIHGDMIANEALSRLRLLSNRIRLGRNDAALVRLVVPVTDSDMTAERRGLDLVRALVSHLL